MTTWQPKRVLGISPHADDLELGAGGTISKWSRNGSFIVHIIFSALKQKEKRLPEIYRANEAIGILKSSIAVYDFENRTFGDRRQQILQLLHDSVDFIKPDVVLVPTSYDTHQDHEVVHREALRAFRNITLLGYEDPWNMYDSSLRLTVSLDDEDIKNKCRSILCHKSQRDRPFMDTKFVIGSAMMRGMATKRKLAENFEVIRWVL